LYDIDKEKENKMKISILSICPEAFDSFINTPLIARNTDAKRLELEIIDIRDHAQGSFRKIDDSPYGGGPGMILKVEPVLNALNSVRSENSHVVLLAPSGKTYKQEDAHRFSEYEHLIIICGHYEGFDQRICSYVDEIISIGDYILCGGELPAMVISESLMRLVDGSMKKASTEDESFENGLLEYPQYTRPYDYKGDKVPDVLLSGDHEAIRKWRYEQSLKLTEKYRPDLLEKRGEKDE